MLARTVALMFALTLSSPGVATTLTAACDQNLNVMFPESHIYTNYRSFRQRFANTLGDLVGMSASSHGGEDWRDPYHRILNKSVDIAFLSPIFAADAVAKNAASVLAHIPSSHLSLFFRNDLEFESFDKMAGMRISTLKGTTSEMITWSLLAKQLPEFRKQVSLLQEKSSRQLLINIASGRSDYGVLPIYAKNYINPSLAKKFSEPVKIADFPGVALVASHCLSVEQRSTLREAILAQDPQPDILRFLENAEIGRLDRPTSGYLKEIQTLLQMKRDFDSKFQ